MLVQLINTAIEIFVDELRSIINGYKTCKRSYKEQSIFNDYYTEVEIEAMKTYKDIKNIARDVFEDKAS